MTLVLMTIMILFGSRGRIDYIGMHTHLCRVKVALRTIMNIFPYYFDVSIALLLLQSRYSINSIFRT